MHYCVRQTHDSPPSGAGSGAPGTPNRSFAVPSYELRTKTEIVIVISSPVGGKALGMGGGVPSQTQQGREVCVQSTHQAGGHGWERWAGPGSWWHGLSGVLVSAPGWPHTRYPSSCPVSQFLEMTEGICQGKGSWVPQALLRDRPSSLGQP